MDNSFSKLMIYLAVSVLMTLMGGCASTDSVSQDATPKSVNQAAVVAMGSVLSGLVISADSTNNNGTLKTNGFDGLKSSLGEEAVLGLGALSECDASTAFTYARQASASSDPDHALAGLWLLALTEADRKNWFEAKAYFPRIRSRDQDIGSQADYDAAVSAASKEMSMARQEYGTAAACNH